METLARTLSRSVRTVQRHLHLLRELGLIEFVERRRNKGRFSSYLYRVLHIGRITTGQRSRKVKGSSNKRRTRPSNNTPQGPIKEGYEWLFEKGGGSRDDANHERQKQEQRRRDSEKRKEGYEWLFE